MNNCVIMRKTNEEKGLYLKLKKMKNKKIEKNRKKSKKVIDIENFICYIMSALLKKSALNDF